MRGLTQERAGRGHGAPVRPLALSLSRRIAGPVSGIVLPALLPLLLDRARGTLNPTGGALLLLVLVVGAARIGGLVSPLVAVVTTCLLLDRRLLPSVGTFSSHDIDDMLVLGVFALVTGVGAVVLDRSLRLARRAAAEAGTLLALAQHRLLAAFATHVTATVERARLVEAAPGAEPVKVAERTRTALLVAVSHDLRLPRGRLGRGRLAAQPRCGPHRRGTR